MSQNITACLRRARLCLGNRPPARAVFTGCGQAAGEAPRGGFPAADARLYSAEPAERPLSQALRPLLIAGP
ncbi:hypothetical protein [Erwinia sp. HR93]|uniref:hypothetical protein n=1 Tax=Erwinia sp. HR93 TaxID=3094840 RepID=UPI002ADEC8BF|nr:hypothetical protein [Erwinia sp. HR93]MEA1062605.1 hypothetical protein [Erwinia sp. HR93]